MKTSSGLEFGLWGGNENASPAPLLFILASTIDETLGSEYFRQCGNRLAREYGWLCVSLDLPYHGKFQKEGSGDGLNGWADAVRQGDNFVSDNNARMREILEFLIREGCADPERIAVCGSSRGGYLALQFAAGEERVKAVTAFAPVTDLSALREFSGVPDNLLATYRLDNHISELAKKKIWIVIGDRDERVGTDLAIELARNLSKASRQEQNGKGQVELNVMFEPKGHTTPKGSVDRAVKWILEAY